MDSKRRIVISNLIVLLSLLAGVTNQQQQQCQSTPIVKCSNDSDQWGNAFQLLGIWGGVTPKEIPDSVLHSLNIDTSSVNYDSNLKFTRVDIKFLWSYRAGLKPTCQINIPRWSVTGNGGISSPPLCQFDACNDDKATECRSITAPVSLQVDGSRLYWFYPAKTDSTLTVPFSHFVSHRSKHYEDFNDDDESSKQACFNQHYNTVTDDQYSDCECSSSDSCSNSDCDIPLGTGSHCNDLVIGSTFPIISASHPYTGADGNDKSCGKCTEQCETTNNQPGTVNRAIDPINTKIPPSGIMDWRFQGYNTIQASTELSQCPFSTNGNSQQVCLFECDYQTTSCGGLRPITSGTTVDTSFIQYIDTTTIPRQLYSSPYGNKYFPKLQVSGKYNMNGTVYRQMSAGYAFDGSGFGNGAADQWHKPSYTPSKSQYQIYNAITCGYCNPKDSNCKDLSIKLHGERSFLFEMLPKCTERPLDHVNRKPLFNMDFKATALEGANKGATVFEFQKNYMGKPGLAKSISTFSSGVVWQPTTDSDRSALQFQLSGTPPDLISDSYAVVYCDLNLPESFLDTEDRSHWDLSNNSFPWQVKGQFYSTGENRMWCDGCPPMYQTKGGSPNVHHWYMLNKDQSAAYSATGTTACVSGDGKMNIDTSEWATDSSQVQTTICNDFSWSMCRPKGSGNTYSPLYVAEAFDQWYTDYFLYYSDLNSRGVLPKWPQYAAKNFMPAIFSPLGIPNIMLDGRHSGPGVYVQNPYPGLGVPLTDPYQYEVVMSLYVDERTLKVSDDPIITIDINIQAQDICPITSATNIPECDYLSPDQTHCGYTELLLSSDQGNAKTVTIKVQSDCSNLSGYKFIFTDPTPDGTDTMFTLTYPFSNVLFRGYIVPITVDSVPLTNKDYCNVNFLEEIGESKTFTRVNKGSFSFNTCLQDQVAVTPSPSNTPSITGTTSGTSTTTPSLSHSNTPPPTVAPGTTHSSTPTFTPSHSPTGTGSSTRTPTVTSSHSTTPSPDTSISKTISTTSSATKGTSPTPSPSVTPSPTATPQYPCQMCHWGCYISECDPNNMGPTVENFITDLCVWLTVALVLSVIVGIIIAVQCSKAKKHSTDETNNFVADQQRMTIH